MKKEFKSELVVEHITRSGLTASGFTTEEGDWTSWVINFTYVYREIVCERNHTTDTQTTNTRGVCISGTEGKGKIRRHVDSRLGPCFLWGFTMAYRTLTGLALLLYSRLPFEKQVSWDGHKRDVSDEGPLLTSVIRYLHPLLPFINRLRLDRKTIKQYLFEGVTFEQLESGTEV